MLKAKVVQKPLHKISPAQQKANRLLTNTKREIKAPTGEKSKEISKTNQSSFRRSLKKLRKYASDEDFDESLNKQTLVALKDMVLDLMPIAEENYRQWRTERAAYALNVLMNQFREIQADERALEDFQSRSDKIKQMFHQHYLYVLQNLMDELIKLNGHLVNTLDLAGDPNSKEKIKTDLQGFLREHSHFIKEASRSVETQLDEYIVRKPGQTRMKQIGR